MPPPRTPASDLGRRRRQLIRDSNGEEVLRQTIIMSPDSWRNVPAMFNHVLFP